MPTDEVTSPRAPPVHCCHWSAARQATSHQLACVSLSLSLSRFVCFAFLPACVISNQSTRSQPEQRRLFLRAQVFLLRGLASVVAGWGKKECRKKPTLCVSCELMWRLPCQSLRRARRSFTLQHALEIFLWKCSLIQHAINKTSSHWKEPLHAPVGSSGWCCDAQYMVTWYKGCSRTH